MFKIGYDYQPDDVVSAISRALEKFNLRIDIMESDEECYMTYKINTLEKIKVSKDETEQIVDTVLENNRGKISEYQTDNSRIGFFMGEVYKLNYDCDPYIAIELLKQKMR